MTDDGSVLHHQETCDQNPDSIRKAMNSSEDIGRLLDQFRPFLQAVAISELPDLIQSKIAASDIVQETILKGMEVSAKFRGSTREELASWLRTILINLMSNYRRTFQSQKRDVAREVTADSRLANLKQWSPAEATLAREKHQVFDDALSRLPESYREAIELRHRDELTFAEIGRRLQKTEEAARKIWKRAVSRLKKELERHDREESR